jgi:hypothetical protein
MTEQDATDATLAAERKAQADKLAAKQAQLDAAKADDAADDARIAELEKQVADLQPKPTSKKPIGSSQGDYFGHVPDGLRIYLQPGEKPARWADNHDCMDVDAGQQCVFSKKVQDTDWLASFLATVPSTIGQLRVVAGIHEPENDPITPAEYLSWVKADVPVIRKAGFIPVQCLMNARDTKWTAYASPDVDEMWWDPYQGGVATNPKQYNTPQWFLGPLMKASASKGKPWGLGELGSLPTVADTSEKGRANWMVDIREFILATDTARGALWFNRARNVMTQQMADAWFAGKRPA